MRAKRSMMRGVPVVAALGLLLAACGGTDTETAAQDAPDAQSAAGTDTAPDAAPAAAADAPGAQAPAAAATQAEGTDSAAAPTDVDAAGSPAGPDVRAAGGDAGKSGAAGIAKSRAKDSTPQAPKDGAKETTRVKAAESGTERARNQQIYEQKDGATDVGITKAQIRLGTISMHGVALGNLLIAPQVRGNLASAQAINDRGGVLGRRLTIIDCDDGTGEVSRSKGCIKKLAGQDRIFALMTSITWATGAIHDDLKQHKLPHIGAWAYSQTEWQDPYMFPTHMSMIHEAMAGARWARDVIKPRTYGLICLTSPEMQLACSEVAKVMHAAGSKLVKKVDVSISETSMSAQVLAMRAQNPEHIIHYVINPATMAKWMVESAQQNYYPPKGISGNHLAAEILGSLFGKHPVNRYWTNTTYKMWGPEFIATMNKYARGNKGTNHHIVQAGYVGMNIFAQAAKEVGPNLTRERLMRVLGSGTVWRSDASLDQKFSYRDSERYGTNWDRQSGQGREFMYRYTSTNTLANPDGSPSGFEPDERQFVIHTH